MVCPSFLYDVKALALCFFQIKEFEDLDFLDWEPEMILATRSFNFETQYLVKYQGRPDTDLRWVNQHYVDFRAPVSCFSCFSVV